MTYRLDQEERDILERGELIQVANPEQEKEYAIQAARNTLKKMKRAKVQKTNAVPRSRE